MGGDLAPNLGGANKFFRGPISGKMSIFRVKISDDLFSVIDLVLRIFPFFSHSFRMFTMLNVVYDHFLTRKTQFFTLFMLSRTSDNTTSQNIGGTNAWAVPPPQILGEPSPQSPPRSPPLDRNILNVISTFGKVDQIVILGHGIDHNTDGTDVYGNDTDMQCFECKHSESSSPIRVGPALWNDSPPALRSVMLQRISSASLRSLKTFIFTSLSR